MSMLPIPSINYIPKLFKDKASTQTYAFTDFLDTEFTSWFTDVKNIDQLLDVEQCPAIFLNYLGNMLNASVNTVDSERTKRQKIYEAINTHKKRGTWVNHAKLIIDSITGYDARTYKIFDSDDWVLCGDGIIEPGTSWSILGGDGTDPYGMALIGDGTEVEIWGNIYIDCHYGIYTAVLTSSQIDQIVYDISMDIVPAYVRVYLGYVPVGGGFTVYSGGTIT
jgi:phage tail-like protein